MHYCKKNFKCICNTFSIFCYFKDRRNFVRAPPAGVDFTFDYDVSYPTAIAIMAEDPNLEEMRFELVPKM